MSVYIRTVLDFVAMHAGCWLGSFIGGLIAFAIGLFTHWLVTRMAKP